MSMANSSRLTRNVGRSPRRRTGWEPGPNGLTGAITAVGATLFPLGFLAAVDGLTVVRTRGMFSWFVDQAPSAAAHMTYAFGLCIVQENAFTVGVTAVQHPFADADWDGWLFHKFGVCGLEAGNVGGISSAFEIDSKAMRKMGQDDVLSAVVEIGTEVGAVSAVARLDTRVLFKLP